MLNCMMALKLRKDEIKDSDLTADEKLLKLKYLQDEVANISEVKDSDFAEELELTIISYSLEKEEPLLPLELKSVHGKLLQSFMDLY